MLLLFFSFISHRAPPPPRAPLTRPLPLSSTKGLTLRTPGGAEVLWKLRTFSLEGNVLLCLESEGRDDDEGGRIVCVLSHSTRVESLDSSQSIGPISLHPFAFVVVWQRDGEEAHVCIAGKDFRDSL